MQERARKNPQNSMSTKKIAISKILNQKYLNKNILAELFSKECHLKLNN